MAIRKSDITSDYQTPDKQIRIDLLHSSVRTPPEAQDSRLSRDSIVHPQRRWQPLLKSEEAVTAGLFNRPDPLPRRPSIAVSLRATPPTNGLGQSYTIFPTACDPAVSLAAAVFSGRLPRGIAAAALGTGKLPHPLQSLPRSVAQTLAAYAVVSCWSASGFHLASARAGPNWSWRSGRPRHNPVPDYASIYSCGPQAERATRGPLSLVHALAPAFT